MSKTLRRMMITTLCIIIMSQGIYAKDIQVLPANPETPESSIYKIDEISDMVKKDLKLSEESRLSDSNLTTDETFQKKVWRMMYENGDNIIQVKADAETGKVLSFEKHGGEDTRIFQLTKEQAKKTAQKYIDDNYEDLKDELVELEDNSIISKGYRYYDRDSYLFVYARKLKNEIMTSNYIIINVSGITGEITSFEIVWNDCRYNKNNKQISMEEARRIFEQEDNLKLKYIEIDTEEEEKNVLTLKPVYYYEMDNSGLLDAVSKKFYNIEDLYSYDDDVLYAGVDCSAKEDAGFAEEMVPEKGSISREKVEQIITEKVSKLTDIKNLKVRSSNYQTWCNGIKGKYWTINLEDENEETYLYGTIDAVSGDVLDINYYSYNLPVEDSINGLNRLKLALAAGEITEEEFEAKAKTMLEAGEVTKEQYDNRLKETNSENDVNDIKKQAKDIISNMFTDITEKDYIIETIPLEEDSKKIYVRGIRVIDDIKYNSNGFDFSYDTENHAFTRFSFEWFNKIETMKPKNTITKEEVNKIFYDEVGITKELVQLKDKVKEEKEDLVVPLEDLSLVYKLNQYDFLYIDMENGKLLGYNGEEFKNTVVIEKFTDIKDYEYKQIIELMNKMGFIKETKEEFAPDTILTKKDAIKWLVLTLNRQYRYIPDDNRNYMNDNEIKFVDVKKDDEYYNYVVSAVEMNIIDNAKYFNKNHKVSLMDMIEWIINGMGDKKLANHIEIFADEDNALESDKGYVGLARYYKIIDSDTDITENLTRGEAIKLLYDFIVNLEDGGNSK